MGSMMIFTLALSLVAVAITLYLQRLKSHRY